jgi:hypothetical protein
MARINGESMQLKVNNGDSNAMSLLNFGWREQSCNTGARTQKAVWWSRTQVALMGKISKKAKTPPFADFRSWQVRMSRCQRQRFRAIATVTYLDGDV